MLLAAGSNWYVLVLSRYTVPTYLDIKELLTERKGLCVNHGRLLLSFYQSFVRFTNNIRLITQSQGWYKKNIVGEGCGAHGQMGENISGLTYYGVGRYLPADIGKKTYLTKKTDSIFIIKNIVLTFKNCLLKSTQLLAQVGYTGAIKRSNFAKLLHYYV